MTVTQEHIAKMAAEQLEELLMIIGDLGYVGYRISLCKIKGNSYMQCAQKFGIPRSTAQSMWEKCTEKAYDVALKRIFEIE